MKATDLVSQKDKQESSRSATVKLRTNWPGEFS